MTLTPAQQDIIRARLKSIAATAAQGQHFLDDLESLGTVLDEIGADLAKALEAANGEIAR